MAESLNVIGLISGGKDSFFSLLHCKESGHKVVALGNLYPPSPPQLPSVLGREGPVKGGSGLDVDSGEHGEEKKGHDKREQRLEQEGEHDDENEEEEEEEDLNSFMYQTVGHTVIPLYEKALGIPLYRQEIIGTAVETGTSYAHHSESESAATPPAALQDETESLVPLLKTIMKAHPEANALSTGAILSTYQRTRIESVALRLGLTPLSYLWKYPVLPPGTQNSLLQDMQDVGLDARIVKVASGGLDESYLWENVSAPDVMRRMERSMKRFGTDGDGAVLGEGGEFETLAVDGPGGLFKGRIEVKGEDRVVVREGGGSAWLKMRSATVVMKDSSDGDVRERCRVPDLLESRFTRILSTLNEGGADSRQAEVRKPTSLGIRSNRKSGPRNILHWTFAANGNSPDITITEEANQIITSICQRLAEKSLEPKHIISTVIILRSMNDFAAFNKVYGALFTLPNPPARITISSGSSMPANTNLLIHLRTHAPSLGFPPRKALHVQSRSYWAPANIGPYSQAISIPLSAPAADNDNDDDDDDEGHDEVDRDSWAVSIAGQIPLIPQSMVLPSPQQLQPESQDPSATALSDFNLQTTLSLQHLYRIGVEMSVSWFSSAIAYIPTSSPISQPTRAHLVGRAWREFHRRGRSRGLAEDDDEDEEEEEERDLWDEKYRAGMEFRGQDAALKSLPDWSAVSIYEGVSSPPVFVAEVQELPRGSGVEWHATLGVISSKIKLFENASEEGFTVHQCVFGEQNQVVISIEYSEDVTDLSERISSAVRAGGIGGDDVEFAAYLDASINGIWDVRDWRGVVPCKGLWDGSGKRLAGLLLFGSC